MKVARRVLKERGEEATPPSTLTRDKKMQLFFERELKLELKI